MTTTQTEPASITKRPEHRTRPDRSIDLPQPTGSPKPLSRLWLITPAVLIVAGFLVWRTAGNLIGTGPAEDIRTYTVAPLSFQVLLHEKGELKAASSIDVKNEVEGVATIISLIPEGTTVKEGDLLIELASDQIDEKIQQSELSAATAEANLSAAKNELNIQIDENKSNIMKAELALDIARTSLRKYVEGDWVQNLTTAKLDIDLAKSALLIAEERKEASERLYAKKFITKAEVEGDRSKLLEAQVKLKKSDLALKIIEEFDHEMRLKQLTSDVEEAKRELQRAKDSASAKEEKGQAKLDSAQKEFELRKTRLAKYYEQKKKTKIHAPGPGLVVYYKERHWDSSYIIKEGGQVREKQTLIKLPDTSVMVVEVRIHEAKSNLISLGQEAVVEVEGMENKRFTGKLTKIAVLADSRDRWLNRDLKEYVTEITLNESDDDLKPGATARAEILVDQLTDVLAVPVQSVYGRAGRRFVFVRGEGRDEYTPVEVGIGQSSDEFAEIKTGLAGGEKVMMVITEEMKQMLADVESGEEAITEVAVGDVLPGAKKGKPKRTPRISKGSDRPVKKPVSG